MSHTQMKLLSTKEAARQTGFSPRTIAKWCRDGTLPAKKVGRVWRIDQQRLVYHFDKLISGYEYQPE